MRARFPDSEGKINRDGIQLHYEVYGQGEQSILFIPPWWPMVTARCFKGQIPYFSQHYRCIAYDPLGNGQSDRCVNLDAYGAQNHIDDALAILDATNTASAILFGYSCSGSLCAALAARYPDQVDAVITISTTSSLAPPHARRRPDDYTKHFDQPVGWQKYNREYWKEGYADFVDFFSQQIFTEAHSTKQIEDTQTWAAQTKGEALITANDAADNSPPFMDRTDYQKIHCPMLLIHGAEDAIIPVASSKAVAAATKGELLVIPGAGHAAHGRYPALVNTLMRDFLARHNLASPKTGHNNPVPAPHKIRRSKKALYLSSPIGLGHARRDLAITRELRKQHPGIEVDWLSQDPVSRFLQANHERIHPASSKLASESSHIESEAGEHDLNAFQALRNMDEILIANFMVFQEAVEDGNYDLIIADEAWDVDHYWHEHPQLKKAQIAWLTDFVGFVPMPDNGPEEAVLTTDYNAEMVHHIERHPGVRDRSIFVGNPCDILMGSFGDNLPDMRNWVTQHFDFCGYVLGEHPDKFGNREELRAALGYHLGEKVCLVTVGGSGVGGALVRRILDAYPMAKRHIPELRMIVVLGPRLDPARFTFPDGVEVHGFVPDLDRHLAACDLALVQGGLTTTMELAAAGTPFLYFPLNNHFEQNFHVTHRLDQYGAGKKMLFDESCPDTIAHAMVDELSRLKKYKPVEADGARRAAQMIAELL
ncbi:MAG: alpha/beta hydrolase [Robiginitomaculum sp.]|nr:MAG: alpha/beta hydrolase [Robiginitomaculum sp.]